MPGIKGMDCKLYINLSTATDPYATPNWQEWKCVRDAKLDISWETADASCRGGGKFKQNLITVGDLKVSGTAIKEKADATFVAAAAANLSNKVLDLLVLDGDKATTTDATAGTVAADGFRFSGQITSWSENQQYTDSVTIDFEVGVARSSHPPVAVTGPVT